MKTTKIVVIATLITIALLFTTALAITPAVAEKMPAECYELDTVVIGWEYFEKLDLYEITCLAEDGNIWCFYDDEFFWRIGDIAVLTLYDGIEEDEVMGAMWTDHLESDELAQFLRMARW